MHPTVEIFRRPVSPLCKRGGVEHNAGSVASAARAGNIEYSKHPRRQTVVLIPGLTDE